MGHKVYISFKTEDAAYKAAIQGLAHLDYVDKSLNEPINSSDPDYILRKIRADYLYDSTVTLFLIGEFSAEDRGSTEQYFIKKELQASLYNSTLSLKSGILGVVLPSMYDRVYGGSYSCTNCGGSHNLVSVNNSTTVREFNYNYYIPNGKCSHSEEDRYCVLVKWADFIVDPNAWIDRAFEKRAAPIASKTRVRPE